MSSFSLSPLLRPASPQPIHPLIAGRWSSRALDENKEISDEVLDRLWEAIRWAPSAYNNQPWRFLFLTKKNPQALARGRETLFPGNAWALKAPVLLFIMTRKQFLGRDKPNPRAEYEAGMAAAMLAVQAVEEGLIFHQMAGFHAKKVRENFAVPEEFSLMAAGALGYPGPVEQLPEDKRAMETSPRERKPLEAIIFTDGSVPLD